MGKNIELKASDGHTLGAYRADPAGTPRGGVVVLQEIFGVTPSIRGLVNQYASAGYVAIAPALFDRAEPGLVLPYTDMQRGMGLTHQDCGSKRVREEDQQVYRMADVARSDVRGLYTYDAFSPLVLFTLERFGFCGPGEAAGWVQGGRIELGGELPVNTSGGLLSEAHVGGWNSVAEMVRQLRGTAGPSQIAGAECLQWGTVWGDSVVLRSGT